MRSTLLLVLSTTLVACSGTETKTPTPTAAAPEAKSGAFRVALGEATVYEVGDPDKAVFKLHADGAIEHLIEHRDREPEWLGEVLVRADGMIIAHGTELLRLGPEITMGDDSDRTQLSLRGDTITIRDGGLPDTVVAFAADSSITLTVEGASRRRWRVEATDRAVGRTVFLLHALTINVPGEQLRAMD